MKERILFVTNSLYPKLNANSSIVYKIASYLQEQYNVEIYMLGLCSKSEIELNNRLFGFNTHSVTVLEKRNRIAREKNKFKKIARFIIAPKSLICHIRVRKGFHVAATIEYQHIIRNLMKKHSFDCIVGFAEPFHILTAISNEKGSIPFLAYELDPKPSENTFIYNINNIDLNNEKMVEDRADAIIMTKVLYSLHNSEYDIDNNSKIIPLEFPCVVKEDMVQKFANSFNPHQIHCVFTGQFYEEIRNVFLNKADL